MKWLLSFWERLGKALKWDELDPEITYSVGPSAPPTSPVAHPLPVPAPSMTPTDPDALLPWIFGKSLTHNNWHNVRALCDLEGLSHAQKETLTACVWVESEFNTNARLDNRDKTGRVWSTDLGICQWNTYFHGKEITPTQSVEDPELAVRLMCKYWKDGRQSQWVSYTSGAYRAHLGKTL